MTLAPRSCPAVGFSSPHSFLTGLSCCCGRWRKRVISCRRQGGASSRYNSETIRFQQEHLQYKSGDCSRTSTGLSHLFTLFDCCCASVSSSQTKQEHVELQGANVGAEIHVDSDNMFPLHVGALFGFCFNPLAPLGAGPSTTHTAVPKTS